MKIILTLLIIFVSYSQIFSQNDIYQSIGKDVNVYMDHSNNIYLMGLRPSETLFSLDGVDVRNNFDGRFHSMISPQSLSNLTVDPFGQSFGFSNASSGSVEMISKIGADEFISTFGAYRSIGDDIGTSNFYGDLSGAIIPKKLYFYASLNTSSVDDFYQFWANEKQTKHNELSKYSLLGNLFYTTDSFSIKATHLQNTFSHNNATWDRLFFNETEHFERIEQTNSTSILNVKRANKNYSINANMYYSKYYRENGDNKWWDDFASYGNKSLNENSGSHPGIITGNGVQPQGYGEYDPGLVLPTNTVFNEFTKRKEERIGGELSFTYKIGKNEFTLGSRYSKSKLRQFSIAPRGLWSSDGFTDEANVRRWSQLTQNYGYDIFGNEVDNGDYLNGAYEERLKFLLEANPNASQDIINQFKIEASNYAVQNPKGNGKLSPLDVIHQNHYLNVPFDLGFIRATFGLNFESYKLSNFSYILKSGSLDTSPIHFSPSSKVFSYTNPRITFKFNHSVNLHIGKYSSFNSPTEFYRTPKEIIQSYIFAVAPQPRIPLGQTQPTENLKLLLTQKADNYSVGVFKNSSTYYLGDDEYDTDNVGLFGETQYDVNEYFALRFGGNYTDYTFKSESLYKPEPQNIKKTFLFKLFRLNNFKIFSEITYTDVVDMVESYEYNDTYNGRSRETAPQRVLSDKEQPITSLYSYTTILEPINYKRASFTELNWDIKLHYPFNYNDISALVFLEVYNLLNNHSSLYVERKVDSIDDGFLESAKGETLYSNINQVAYRYRLLDPIRSGMPTQIYIGIKFNL